jgi:zinc transporter, ZIP family
MHMAFAFVLLFSLLPALGSIAGSLLVLRLRTPQWLIDAALHASAGIAIALVSIELMPRIVSTTPMKLVIAAFIAGAFVSLIFAVAFRQWPLRTHTHAWMIYVALWSIVFGDGLMTGVSASIAGRLGLFTAIARAVANLPGGFGASANLLRQGVSRNARLLTSASLCIPALLSGALGYWLLKPADAATKNSALAVVVGALLTTTILDMLPESEHSDLPRWLSTVAFAGGFCVLAALSVLK